MCGIAGHYNWQTKAGQSDRLLAKLFHRGPDDNGIYVRDHVSLLHTRLSIIDLTDLASQPYRFENLVLVFNGEIYNYKEVRAELVRFGYNFLSNSDTEVVVKAFHRWREKAVDHFIGMFAFAIYDEHNDSIYLFRDRAGVKPLYYSCQNNSIAFASELKALAILVDDHEINEESIALYLRYGFVPNGHSVYTRVNKLEPGSYLVFSNAGVRRVKYWVPRPNVDQSKSEREWLGELEALLMSAFSYRMIADVPVGIFLSGGIDSSLLAALLRQKYSEVNSFTIGFNETAFDESRYARGVAQHLGLHHHEKILDLKEAKGVLQHFYQMYDEPFADTSGIPTSCVTKVAKEAGMKVVLSADGGDELFGGYSHYQKALSLYQRIQRIPYRVRKAMVTLSKRLINQSVRNNLPLLNFEHKLFAIEELLLADDLPTFFEAFIANQAVPEIETILNHSFATLSLTDAGYDDTPHAMLEWDFANYLPDDLLVKVDRATMYHGLECREPFLDHRVVEMAWRMPIDFKMKNGAGKYPLKQILSRYVPSAFYERKKQGFSIPIFDWFKDDLDQYFADYFTDEALKIAPFLNKTEVQREYKKYRYYRSINKEYNIEKMWRLLSLLMWVRNQNSVE